MQQITNNQAIQQADQIYANNFTDGNLPEEASKHFVILTCMDARIDPNDFAGLHPGEAYILRNGGGRVTSDMIRSLLLVTRLFGVDEYFVIHHTDCGLEKFDDSDIRELLRTNLGPCTPQQSCGRDDHNRDKSGNADNLHFYSFPNLKQSVIDDVRLLRNNPLISKKVRIYGYIYRVSNGKLEEVEEASRIGARIDH